MLAFIGASLELLRGPAGYPEVSREPDTGVQPVKGASPLADTPPVRSLTLEGERA
jgi:hypothetical protein